MTSDTFFRLVPGWLTVHLSRPRRLSPHTIRSWKTALGLLLDYLRETRGVGLWQVGFDQIDQASTTGLTETRNTESPESAQAVDSPPRSLRVVNQP